MVKVNPGSSFEKKPQGMGIQPLGTKKKSGSILKLLLFQSFCTSSRKIPFASYIILYDILFYFIHVYIASGQEETTLEDNFLWKQKGLITLITGCMFQKIALPSDFMQTFHDFIHVYSLWAGADNPLGPKFWCQLWSFVASLKKKTLQPLTLYIPFCDLINVYSRRSWADNPQGTKFWCQQKLLVTSVITTSLKILFEVWFYTHFFSWFYSCI